MKHHHLKIKYEYAREKLSGAKPFEVRKNDRKFQVGDIVTYTCPENEECDKDFHGRVFKITSVSDFEQKEGFVVFAEKSVDKSWSRNWDVSK